MLFLMQRGCRLSDLHFHDISVIVVAAISNRPVPHSLGDVPNNFNNFPLSGLF